MKTRRRSRYAAVTVTALLAGLGLGACGGSSTKTVTPATSSSQTSTSAGGGATNAQPIPDYQPSKVKVKSVNATVLTSPDSVGKIGAFYKDELAKGGWDVISESTSAYHASFTAHRGKEVVSISVYRSGSGSGITIAKRSG